ncbi:MAG: putative zinc-binding protein [Candidatus Bathyarchaeota archaeon]
MSDPILVIPCSGIGKVFGSIGRDATYCVVEDLRKGEAETLCLSLLVMGDEEVQHLVKSHRCIAIDGCPAECARKNLELADAKLAASFRVVDIVREQRSLKPKGITFLDEDGLKMSRFLAEKVALKIDELNKKEATK